MRSLHASGAVHPTGQHTPALQSYRRLAQGRPSAASWPHQHPRLSNVCTQHRGLAATRPTWRRDPRQGAAAAAAPSSGADNDAAGQSDAGDERDGDGLAAVADRLSLAVAAEDYERAAALRDELARRTQDGREAVLDANQRFYDAFQSCSPRAMAEVWGEGDHVQCIHPVSGVIAGREDVLASWEMVLGAGGSVNIRLAELRVALLGSSRAFVTCTELINATDNRGRIAATNIFEKQNGEWRIIHHHGSPSPPPPQPAQRV